MSPSLGQCSDKKKREPISVKELLVEHNSSADDLLQNTQTDKDEFEQYRTEFLPHVKHGTALYAFHKRLFAETVVIDKGKVLETFYPEAKDPAWSVPDDFYESNLPCNSAWVSDIARVMLRREPGTRRFDDTQTAASLGVQLRQTVSAREPYLWLRRTKLDRETEEMTEHTLVVLTLTEAVELAHTLLLCIDVAKESLNESGA